MLTRTKVVDILYAMAFGVMVGAGAAMGAKELLHIEVATWIGGAVGAVLGLVYAFAPDR